MTTPTRRRGGSTEQHHKTPHVTLSLAALHQTVADLQHLAALAATGLSGTEPEDGLDLLFDAQDLLSRDLAPFRQMRRRGDA